ncbi:MAG: zf-HC2 domain-containing protein, partial [Acidimicrobiales bacterium]
HPVAASDAMAGAFGLSLARPVDAAPGAEERLRLTLLRATRIAAIDAVGALAAVRNPGGLVGFEPGERRVALVREAFHALPERWRSILWLVDVEGCTALDAARVLELAPDAVGPLLERARLGLQEQVLLSGSGDASPADCRRTTDRLTGYAAGTLAARDEARTRRHLDGCGSCRDRLAALDDLIPVLRGTAIALPILLASQAATVWSASLVRDRGPLRLGLPGGAPMPAWAQRALAGSVAALVALGITGATMLAGGRGRGARDVASRPITASGPTVFGDQGLADLSLDGPGFVAPALSLGTASGAAAGSVDAPRSGAALPRTDGPAVADSAGSSPFGPAQVDPTGPASLPPGSTPPPPPPATGGGALVTAGVAGVASVTVGDACSGGQVLGNAIGCAPPASSDPVTVDGAIVSALPLGL